MNEHIENIFKTLSAADIKIDIDLNNNDALYILDYYPFNIELCKKNSSITRKTFYIIDNPLLSQEKICLKINKIISKNPSLNLNAVEIRYQKSPLMTACYTQQYDVAKFLLENGADANAIGSKDFSFSFPLHALFYYQPKDEKEKKIQEHMVKLLLDYGADATNIFKWASENKHIKNTYSFEKRVALLDFLYDINKKILNSDAEIKYTTSKISGLCAKSMTTFLGNTQAISAPITIKAGSLSPRPM